MNRKLLILDIVLGAAVIYGGFEFRSQWVAAKARQAGMPGPAPKAGPPPAIAPLPQAPAVLPSGYAPIAINTLFDPSRNPNVAPPPLPAPPPPEEPPALPSLHGSMDLGDGPFAMMSESGATAYSEVRAGGMIGPFKLVSFNRREFEVEWKGKIIHKRVEEGGGDKPARAAQPSGGPVVTLGVIPGQAVPEAAPAPVSTAELGPGASMTDTVKACVPSDGSPAGTISGGYRKEVNRSPLGSSQCIWRAIGK